MNARRWGSCAVVFLVFGMAGCAITDFLGVNTEEGSVGGDDRYVNASVAVVTEATKKVLLDMKINATETPGDENMVLHCTTPRGNRFDLHLTRWDHKSAKNEPLQGTQIDIQWVGTPNKTMAIQLFAGIHALSNS